MKFLLRLFAALVCMAAFGAAATPLTTNASDIWWDPAESGWGLNVIHQGDTLFATLFVYAPSGQPRWYSASLVTGGDGPSHDRPMAFSGDLYESTGPAYTSPSFDPNAVRRRQVGTITFELSGITADVRYSVDGVSVSKRVRRAVMRAMGLTGTYVGYQNQPSTSPGGAINDEMTMTVNLSGSAFTMTTQGSASGSCNYSGTQFPNGQLSNITGTYSCADGRSGSFSMLDVDVTMAGFTSRFSGNRIQEPFFGRMGGARTSAAIRGDGWRTDLWWDPRQSGWGLNLIEQSDIVFATLFVYDAAGQPRWYSASLSYQGRGPAVDSTGVYSGDLYESTGPYFGTSFNPDAVTRRRVGTMSFDVYGSRTGFLDYSIDGFTVSRKVLDRFTFRTNDLSGAYVGHLAALANDRGVPTGAASFNISMSGGAATFAAQVGGTGCTFSGQNTYQAGQIYLVYGPFSCTNGRSGSFAFYDIDVSFSGFTASYDIDGYLVGRIEGVRTGRN